MDSKLAPADQIAAGIAANAKGVANARLLRELRGLLAQGSYAVLFVSAW